MEKVVHIVKGEDKKADLIYWQKKSYEERLEAIEFLRSQYYSLNKDVQQRFQRVCRVVNKAQG